MKTVGMFMKEMTGWDRARVYGANTWHPNFISVFPKVLDNPIPSTGYLFPWRG